MNVKFHMLWEPRADLLLLSNKNTSRCKWNVTQTKRGSHGSYFLILMVDKSFPCRLFQLRANLLLRCCLFPKQVVILETGRTRWLGIGIVNEGYNDNKMPGWIQESVGYHTDDGNIFYNTDDPDDAIITKGRKLCEQHTTARLALLSEHRFSERDVVGSNSTLLFEMSRRSFPGGVVCLSYSVGYSKLIKGLIAATSGALVCWRPSLLLTC